MRNGGESAGVPDSVRLWRAQGTGRRRAERPRLASAFDKGLTDLAYLIGTCSPCECTCRCEC